MIKIKSKIISIIIVFFLSVSISSAAINNSSSSSGFSWNDFSTKIYCGFSSIFGVNNNCTKQNISKNTSVLPIVLAQQINSVQKQFNTSKNISKNNNSFKPLPNIKVASINGDKIIYNLETQDQQKLELNDNALSNSVSVPNSQNFTNSNSFVTTSSQTSSYVPVVGPAGIAGKNGSYISFITQGPTSTTYFMFDPNTNSTSTMNVANGDNLSTNNLNTTNATVTNLFSTNSTSSNFFANVLNAVTSSFTNLFATNATITNLSINNSSSTNENVLNLSSINSSSTNSTSSNFFANILTAITSSFTNLFATNATITNLVATNSTSSNSFSNNANIVNLNVVNASEINATTTNLSVTHLNTSNNLSLNGNVLTSNIGGSTGTSSIISSNVASSSGNTFKNIVNGIVSNTVNIINSLTQSISGNVLTTNVNGVIATSSVISSNSISLNGTTLTSNINGVSTSTDLNSLSSTTNATATNLSSTNSTSTNTFSTNLNTTNASSTNFFANILNAVTSVFINLFASNATITNLTATNLNTNNNLSLNGNILTSNVGGSISTTSLASLGSGGGSNSSTTNIVSSSLNLITSIVNGNVSSTTIINSNVASSSNNLLQTVVNGISSNAISIINSLNQSVSGNVLTTNINGILATSTIISSSSLSLSGNTLTSSVNGVSSSLNINNLTSLNLLGNNSNKLTLIAGSSTNNISLTLPSSLGLNNQLLSTDNTGVLSFRSLIQSDIPDLSSLYSNLSSTQTFTSQKIINPTATATSSGAYLPSQSFGVNYSLLTDMSYSLTGTSTLGAQNETFSGYSATTSFNSNGQKLSSTTNWPTTIGTAYYTDYVIVANSTYPSIQNFSIETAVTGGSGQLIGALSYSLDGGSTFTSVGTFNFLSSSGSFATSTFSNMGIFVSSGQNVKFRLYVYASGTITSSRSIYIRNAKFTGQTNLSIMSLRGFDIEGTYNASANQNILSALYINGTYNNNSYSNVMNYDLYQANSNAFNYFAGNVGISQSNPSYALHVGNSSTPGIVARFQNQNGTCDINPTSASLSCSSDMNLKKNIADLESDNDWNYNGNFTINSSSTELDKLMLLKPVQYNWKRESDIDSKHAGFIAQEVEQVFPDLVTTDSTTHLKSLNYLGLIPYTVKAIQEIKESLASSTAMQAFVTNDTQNNEDSAINTNNSGTLVSSIETENQENPIDYINSRITKGLSIMTNFVVGRITAIKGYFYEIFANKITSNNIETSRINTNQLCVNNICITSDQFLKMIQQSGVSTSSPVSTVNDISTSTNDVSTSSVPDNSTSTDSVSTTTNQ